MLCDLGQVLSLSGLQFLCKIRGLNREWQRSSGTEIEHQRQGVRDKSQLSREADPAFLMSSGKVRLLSPLNVERILLP